MVADDYASISWKKIVDYIFVTVDVNCNGFLSKREIATSCVAHHMPHFEDFEMYANRKDGHVDRVEWDQWWMESIFTKKCGGDNASMGRFVGKICVEAGIDVTELLSEDDKWRMINAAREPPRTNIWVLAGILVLVAGVGTAVYSRARASTRK